MQEMPDSATQRRLEIRFLGSGSEYFRIWIVNLLLTLVTAGLYWPFAKARRLRYFYGNTEVDGHALAFHGDPWRMFRGFLLMVALGGVYAVASHATAWSGLIALAAAYALWPALWRSSMRFRMGQTSWRGLRFRFEGGLKDAYLALAPLYLPVLVMVALPLALGLDPKTMEEGGVDKALVNQYLIGTGLCTALLLLLTPWCLSLIKRYQHQGYALAQERCDFNVRTRSWYWLSAKALGLVLLIMAAAGGVLFLLVSQIGGGEATKFLAAAAFMGVFYALLFVVLMPFWVVRQHNLVWGGTHSPSLQFSSTLPLGRYLGLTLKNTLLTVITLGLYRPFAAVAASRMRLESVSLAMSGDIETWVTQQSTQQDAAAADFAGDFFGIDMGL
ncbi:YjgN family protein [Roseateles sp. BYS180W]|uniref:YjgN family protein n=1 Tax=Roseateles rivi TaxID=3299028 RepID=A0ABW7FTC3_9BURK